MFIKDAKNHRNQLNLSFWKTQIKNITNTHINRFGPLSKNIKILNICFTQNELDKIRNDSINSIFPSRKRCGALPKIQNPSRQEFLWVKIARKKYSSSTLLPRAVMGRISDDLSEEDSNSVSREKVVRRSPLNYEK